MKKLSALLAIVVCVACGESLPEPVMPGVSREMVCKTNILIYILGDNQWMIEKVLRGEMTVADAVSLMGALDEDIYDAVELYRQCEYPGVSPVDPTEQNGQPRPLEAPPPAPGNKVM